MLKPNMELLVQWLFCFSYNKFDKFWFYLLVQCYRLRYLVNLNNIHVHVEVSVISRYTL